MKKQKNKTAAIIRFLCSFLAVTMIFQSAATAFASTVTKSAYTSKSYTHNSKFDGLEITSVIDVSYHNGTIDFASVKASGIDGVIVRVGYTGYTKSKHSLNYDTNYKTYIQNAYAAGLKVGVYWYSQALDESEAIAEANKLLSGISGYSSMITLPVVCDYEFADVSSGRLDSANLSKSQMTTNALAFLNTIAAAGYTPMFYANENFLKNTVNASDIDSVYKVWLANYSTKTSYTGNYEFWQYSSSGKVSGISGSVDVNFWYHLPIVESSESTTTTAPAKVTGVALKSRTNTTLTLKWTKLSGVDSYNIWRYDSSSDSYILAGQTSSNTNSYKVSKLSEGTSYSFKVSAVKSGIEGSRSSKFKTVTSPRKVQVKSVKSSKKKRITFKWKKYTCTGYQYQWSTSKNFTNNYITKTTKSTSVTIKTAQSKKKYYVRVRAYKTDPNGKKIYGKWSSVKSIKVK